jgi:hypothetical protein
MALPDVGVLKGNRKTVMFVLALATVIVSGLVGDITTPELIKQVVYLALGFMGANGLEHIGDGLKN